MIANLTYLCLFFATLGSALLLEHLRSDRQRSYAPRWTWLTVVAGVALVGAFVALHLWSLPVAPEPDRWQVWQVWYGTPGRADVAQWVDLCDQTTNAYRSGDRAHALRCLWQMAVLAAGSPAEARRWAAGNAE